MFHSSFFYPSKYRGRTSDTSTYSSLGSLSDLWSVLSEEEMALFKPTAIRDLTDTPRDQSWSKAIFCFLMSRQIKVEPGEYLNDEILFRVKDTKLFFGKAEFSLISGLRFRDLRDGHSDFDSPPKMSRLKHKYFSDDNIINGGHLYDFLFCNTVSKDRAKVVGETSNAIKKVSNKMLRRCRICEGSETVQCEGK